MQNPMVDLRRWPDADGILDQALALPAGERSAFLRRAAGADAALLAALAYVIGEAGRDDGFLDPGGAWGGVLGEEVGRALEGPLESSAPLRSGSRIEHYEIVAMLGRGGMGEVYRARDIRLRA